MSTPSTTITPTAAPAPVVAQSTAAAAAPSTTATTTTNNNSASSVAQHATTPAPTTITSNQTLTTREALTSAQHDQVTQAALTELKQREPGQQQTLNNAPKGTSPMNTSQSAQPFGNIFPTAQTDSKQLLPSSTSMTDEQQQTPQRPQSDLEREARELLNTVKSKEERDKTLEFLKKVAQDQSTSVKRIQDLERKLAKQDSTITETVAEKEAHAKMLKTLFAGFAQQATLNGAGVTHLKQLGEQMVPHVTKDGINKVQEFFVAAGRYCNESAQELQQLRTQKATLEMQMEKLRTESILSSLSQPLAAVDASQNRVYTHETMHEAGRYASLAAGMRTAGSQNRGFDRDEMERFRTSTSFDPETWEQIKDNQVVVRRLMSQVETLKRKHPQDE